MVSAALASYCESNNPLDAFNQADCDAWQGRVSDREFRIRAADSAGHRSSASILVSRRYAWRGYHNASLPLDRDPNQVTLVAVDGDQTVGTMSVGFDSDKGLLVDSLFSAEIAPLRARGGKLCEFTKLAMDSMVRSKHVLASLFHVAYIYGHRLGGCSHLLIEVNPRHVRFYERMLGFKVLGPERLNLRVNAPAVLLCLDFSHARKQIERFGGKAEFCESERSLYPYFFSAREEAGIVGRMDAADAPVSDFGPMPPSPAHRHLRAVHSDGAFQYA
jgi:hypothetical protein